jgi:phosphoribosylformylglycinamidine synthase
VGTVLSKDQDGSTKLILTDRESKDHPVPIDLPMDALFPPGRKLERVVQSRKKTLKSFDVAASLKDKFGDLGMNEAISYATQLVFGLPAVGSKMFLITIGDRVSDLLRGPLFMHAN